MVIDLDVHTTAARFGLDPALVQAVIVAEGNIVRAVACSIPSIMEKPEADRRQFAIEVVCRSAVHAMSDYLKAPGAGRAEGFVHFWANRWAPPGASNDPRHLNENWPGNVLAAWKPAIA